MTTPETKPTERKVFVDGWYNNLSNEDYHAAAGFSKSTLSLALRSGRAYQYHVIEGHPQKTTAAKREGRILHKICLEFDDFHNEFAVEPEIPEGALGNSTELKAWIEKYNESLPKPPAQSELVEVITAHNDGLAKPVKAGVNIEQNKEAFAQIPNAWLQSFYEGEPDEVDTKTRKALIKQYNDSLPKPLKTSGNYDTILEEYARLEPEKAKAIAAIPAPLTLGGKKEELIERIKAVDSTVQFVDEIQAEFQRDAEENHKEVVTQAEYQHALRYREAVFAHPEASLLLNEGVAEQSLFWTDPKTGKQMKCRTDWRTKDNIVADLKFVYDASPASFERDAGKYHYHMQDAHYSDGIELTDGERPTFVFIAVEKDAPLGQEAFKPILVGVYYYCDEARAKGLALRDAAMANILHWQEVDHYPAFDGYIEIDLPNYQANREQAYCEQAGLLSEYYYLSDPHQELEPEKEPEPELDLTIDIL